MCSLPFCFGICCIDKTDHLLVVARLLVQNECESMEPLAAFQEPQVVLVPL